jgi:hypothetical protein
MLCTFWKYVSSFTKSDKNSIELEVDGNHLSQPYEAAEAFAVYIKSVFNNPHLRDSSTASRSWFLIFSICLRLRRAKAIKRLRPSKFVGRDIPAFIINGSSDIFIPVLTFLFKLGLSQRSFPTLW